MEEEIYDKWNEVKKKINREVLPVNFFLREREVWWCSLGMNIGVEANGKNDVFERPLLILKVFNKNMIWGLPITSTLKNSYFYYGLKFNDEYRSVNITQIRVVSSKRLLRKVDVITEEDFSNITKLLISILEGETPTNLKLNGGISEPEGDNKISIT
jgi:mRNA interferase MazF